MMKRLLIGALIASFAPTGLSALSVDEWADSSVGPPKSFIYTTPIRVAGSETQKKVEALQKMTLEELIEQFDSPITRADETKKSPFLQFVPATPQEELERSQTNAIKQFENQEKLEVERDLRDALRQ